MSRIEVYAERASGDVTRYGDVPGSWGGAMHIWTALMIARGLIPPRGYRGHEEALGRVLLAGMDNPANPLVKMWRSLPEIYAENARDAWVLGMTFDRVLVRRRYLRKLAGCVRSFRDQYNDTHWRTLYDLARLLEHAADDPDVVALGFNHTSVADCFWWVCEADPLLDEDEDEEVRPYNTSTDEGHWYLNPTTMRGRATKKKAGA